MDLCPFKLRSSNDSTVHNNINANKENIVSKCIIYPNPNDGNFNVKYEIQETQIGILKIFDIMGRLLLTENLKSGNNILPINASELDAGVYFYQALVGNKKIAGGKIVVIK